MTSPLSIAEIPLLNSNDYRMHYDLNVLEHENDYVGLEGNPCRNSHYGFLPWFWTNNWINEQKEPWCFVKRNKVKCGIPKCGKFYLNIHYPIHNLFSRLTK